MALRTVRQDGDSILRKKCRPVKEITPNIITLLEDLAETMAECNGAGIAAPQVGVLRRVAVVDSGDGVVELINPEIVEQEGGLIDREGCLSVPGKVGTVERPTYVKVKTLNRNGEETEVEGREMMARAFCHEIDHLNGILFTDKVLEYIDMSEKE